MGLQQPAFQAKSDGEKMQRLGNDMEKSGGAAKADGAPEKDFLCSCPELPHHMSLFNFVVLTLKSRSNATVVAAPDVTKGGTEGQLYRINSTHTLKYFFV